MKHIITAIANAFRLSRAARIIRQSRKRSGDADARLIGVHAKDANGEFLHLLYAHPPTHDRRC